MTDDDDDDDKNVVSIDPLFLGQERALGRDFLLCAIIRDTGCSRTLSVRVTLLTLKIRSCRRVRPEQAFYYYRLIFL